MTGGSQAEGHCVCVCADGSGVELRGAVDSAWEEEETERAWKKWFGCLGSGLDNFNRIGQSQRERETEKGRKKETNDDQLNCAANVSVERGSLFSTEARLQAVTNSLRTTARKSGLGPSIAWTDINRENLLLLLTGCACGFTSLQASRDTSRLGWSVHNGIPAHLSI